MASPAASTSEMARLQSRPLPPRAPPPSNTLTKLSQSMEVMPPRSTRDERVDALVGKFVSTLGAPTRAGAEKNLRHVLSTWTARARRDEGNDDSTSTQKAGRSRNRPKQRPSLPMEARGRMPSGACLVGNNSPATYTDPLAVRGSPIDSMGPARRLSGGAEAAAAMWEKRYNLQLSATEEALQSKRIAEISLREVERILENVRGEVARPAQGRGDASTSSSQRKVRRENEGETVRQQPTGVRDGTEAILRQDLPETQAQLTAQKREAATLREALAAAQNKQSLQPVIVSLGQILTECLATMGLIRGVPDSEFHARLSALRDRAEEAARGFVSVEGLHAAAEGARALDANRALKSQLQEALADASLQRARRAEADGKLMEREAGDRTGHMTGARLREDLLKEQKAGHDLRLRLAVAEGDVRRLRETLQTEQQKRRPVPAVTLVHTPRHSDMVQIAAVEGVIEEGRRDVEEKLKLKALQVQQDLLLIRQNAVEAAEKGRHGIPGQHTSANKGC